MSNANSYRTSLGELVTDTVAFIIKITRLFINSSLFNISQQKNTKWGLTVNNAKNHVKRLIRCIESMVFLYSLGLRPLTR